MWVCLLFQRTVNCGSVTFIALALNCPLRDLRLHTYPVKSSALPTWETWPSFDWLWIVGFVIWDCILTQRSPAHCQLWRLDLHVIGFELSALWFETAYLPSEVQRAANCGGLTFIWLALNCRLRYLRLHTYPVKCSVLPTVKAWSSFDWLWIVRHVIWVCVLTQMSIALPSMQAVNFIFSRLFHGSNQRPLAPKLSTQPTVLARLRWGCEEYLKYSCHKLISSSPTKKKKNAEYTCSRPPAPNPSARPTVLARLRRGFEENF